MLTSPLSAINLLVVALVAAMAIHYAVKNGRRGTLLIGFWACILLSTFSDVMTAERWGSPTLLLVVDGLSSALLLLIGPLLYLHLRATVAGKSLSGEDTLHALPAMLFAGLVCISLPFTQGTDINVQLPSNALEWVVLLTVLGLFVLQMGAYLLASWRLLWAGKRRAESERSMYGASELIRLQWLLWLLAAVWAVWGANVLFLNLPWLAMLQSYSLVAMVYFISQYSLLLDVPTEETAPATGYSVLSQGAISSTTAEPKPEASEALLSPQAGQALSTLIHQHLWDARLCTQPDLTLRDLSAAIGASPHHTSYVLNQLIGRNFYQLVNDYRTQLASELLDEPRRAGETVLALGLEAGFASKTTFNTAFKERMGLSPTAYRKRSR